jgi:hypothetical protein
MTIGGSAVVMAPGTAAFFYSFDGVTYTQLGATVTGLTTNGFKANGTTGSGWSIGGIAGQTVPNGKVFSASVRDSAKTLISPTFTALPTTGPTSTFADNATTPNTYSFYTSGHIV